MRAVVGEARLLLPGGRQVPVVRHHRADRHHVVEDRLEVLVVAELVGGGVHREHVVARGVVEGAAREARGGRAAEGHVDDARARIDGVDRALGDTFALAHEGVVDPDVHERAVRADPGDAAAVVGLGGDDARAPGAVAEVPMVELVAVVVVRVPTREVVHVAVAVVVEVIDENPQVAAIERARAVRVADPRVAGVILDVEDAVGVAVPRIADWRDATAADRRRQLAAVQPDLVPQVLVVVVHAAVEHGDDRVVPSGGHLPREVRRDATRSRGERDVVVEAQEVPLARRPVARRRGRADIGRVARVVRGSGREDGEGPGREQCSETECDGNVTRAQRLHGGPPRAPFSWRADRRGKGQGGDMTTKKR